MFAVEYVYFPLNLKLGQRHHLELSGPSQQLHLLHGNATTTHLFGVFINCFSPVFFQPFSS